jgi:hypothetical protein
MSVNDSPINKNINKNYDAALGRTDAEIRGLAGFRNRRGIGRIRFLIYVFRAGLGDYERKIRSRNHRPRNRL